MGMTGHDLVEQMAMSKGIMYWISPPESWSDSQF